MKYDLRKSTEIMHQLTLEKRAEREKKEKEEKEKALLKTPPSAAGLDTQEYIDKCDIPGAMDDGIALLLYIVVMVVGTIFNDRWLIWVISTIVYLRHVFRRQIHKAEWERNHRDK